MLSPRITKVANYTLLKTDAVVDFNATGAARTATLPADADLDAIFVVAKIDASANPVTVVPSGIHTINGDASLVLASKDDLAAFQSLGDGNFRILWKSLANPEKQIDITTVATIADAYVYSPGFTPRLVLLFHADAGNVMGYGWAVGTGTAQQGSFFRDATSSLTKQNAGSIAIYANGHSVYKVTAFGATVTISRTVIVEDLKNVILIAFK